MSDFDQMTKNDLNNPFSPYYLNKPTISEIENNPEKYLGSATINLPKGYNNETVPKTNFFNKKAPDIRRIRNIDSFEVANNDIQAIKKKQALVNVISATIAGLGIGMLSGKMLKLPKINFSKFKFPKIKMPKLNLPKFKLPKESTKNLVANIKNNPVSKKLGQYFAKAKNLVTKKVA